MLQEQQRSIRARERASEALAGPLLKTEAALLLLLEQHTAPNFESDAVIPEAVRVALAFVRAMPRELPMPDVDVAPDGRVILDWTPARWISVGVSIGKSGRLAFSWVYGSDSGHGVYSFDGFKVPDDITEAIRKVADYGARVRTA